jgi:hypothetical protein
VALGISSGLVDHGWDWGFYVGLFQEEEVVVKPENRKHAVICSSSFLP